VTVRVRAIVSSIFACGVGSRELLRWRLPASLWSALCHCRELAGKTLSSSL